MATISLSSAWVTNTGNKLTTGVSTGASASWYATTFWGTGGSSDYPVTEVRMYKGTPPASTVSWATKGAYDADLLALWDYNSIGFTVVNDTVKLYSTASVAASQSGTAAWFAFACTGYATTNWIWSGIGTVGTVGSGADMVIGSTSITSGALYAFSDLKFIVPSSFTY